MATVFSTELHWVIMLLKKGFIKQIFLTFVLPSHVREYLEKDQFEKISPLDPWYFKNSSWPFST